GEIAKQCAQLQLRQVETQLKNQSVTEISGALAGFGTIQGPSGKIVNADKADHIGEWFAKRTAMELGTKIAAQINSRAPAGTYVVMTDTSALTGRPKLTSVVSQLTALQDALDTQSRHADEVLRKVAPEAKPKEGERIGFPALLSLVPPAINAFK